ncbi:MAG TPA: OsmC family protein [Sphingobacteriaceae bacterium]|nr:OsmC family protein [Sphingobacteriaceae bacterium]
MAFKRYATAKWSGSGLEGKGSLNGPSGVLNETPYNFKARFQNEDGKNGTNPEELIAAAHAGCFAMALSFQIVGAGFTADELETKATITVSEVEGGFAFSDILLELKGKVSGMDEDKFRELAEVAKANCPVSKALESVPISLQISYSS